MNPMFKRSSTCAGFTLLELIIALLLLSMMLLLLFSGLRVSSRSWEAVEQQTAEFDRLRLVHGFLQRTLGQAQAIARNSDQGRDLLFDGNETAIEFVSPMPSYLGVGGLYLIRLEWFEQGDRSELWLTRWLYHPEVLEGGNGIPAWKPLNKFSHSQEPSAEDSEINQALYSQHLLLEDIESLEWQYYGQERQVREDQWMTEWHDQLNMPHLVRLRLEQATGWWPELNIALPGSLL